MNLWRPAAEALLAALLAPPCAVCGRVLDRPLAGAVCDLCWATLATAPCRTCGVCPSIALGLAIGEYEGALRSIIHALKYDGRRSVAAPLAALMARHGAEVLAGADVIVPVPLHRRRQRERGFNQADDLARGLQRPVQRPLSRVRMTRPQVDLPAAERQRNVKDAFVLTTPIHGVVVLVDDVITTGATIEACARVLKAGGAREVRALTAARVSSAPR